MSTTLDPTPPDGARPSNAPQIFRNLTMKARSPFQRRQVFLVVIALFVIALGIFYLTSWGYPISAKVKPWKLSTGKPCARSILGKELVADEHGAYNFLHWHISQLFAITFTEPVCYTRANRSWQLLSPVFEPQLTCRPLHHFGPGRLHMPVARFVDAAQRVLRSRLHENFALQLRVLRQPCRLLWRLRAMCQLLFEGRQSTESFYL